MSTEQINTIVNQTAGMVATELGEGWSVDTEWEGWGALLVGPNGARVALTHERTGYTNDNVDRVQVAGVYPYQAHNMSHYNPLRFKATVRRDRGPGVIAREINRRVLCGYLPELRKVNAAIVKAEADGKAKAQTFTHLAAIVPGATTHEDKISLRLPDGWGHLRLNGDGTQVRELEFSYIPSDLAEAILIAVRDYLAR